jgi:hypothetical protein
MDGEGLVTASTLEKIIIIMSYTSSSSLLHQTRYCRLISFLILDDMSVGSRIIRPPTINFALQYFDIQDYQREVKNA